MSKVEQIAFFQSHIDTLKAKEERAAKKIINAGSESLSKTKKQNKSY